MRISFSRIKFASFTLDRLLISSSDLLTLGFGVRGLGYLVQGIEKRSRVLSRLRWFGQGLERSASTSSSRLGRSASASSSRLGTQRQCFEFKAWPQRQRFEFKAWNAAPVLRVQTARSYEGNPLRTFLPSTDLSPVADGQRINSSTRTRP